VQRLSKLNPEQRKLLEIKLKQQGVDIHQIPITKEYRKNYNYFPLSMEQEPMWVVDTGQRNDGGGLDIELLERSTNFPLDNPAVTACRS
jgi:hypothetical protein